MEGRMTSNGGWGRLEGRGMEQEGERTYRHG